MSDTLEIKLKLYPQEIRYQPNDLDNSSEARPVPEHSSTEVQTTQGIVESSIQDSDNSGIPIFIDSDIPVPVMKRYAHHGKRRRAYTEEMFRCQLTDMISRTPLICGHLLWKNRPEELRNHLAEHMKVEEVANLTDSEVLAQYTDAKKIFLKGVSDDPDYTDDDPEGDVDE